MAGPSVSVRILGDTKDFSRSVADTGAQVEKTTGRMHQAFSSVLGMVNRTGVLGPFGDALDTIDQTLGDLSKKGKDAGLAMIGVGGAVAGIGYGLSALGSKDQAARQQLAASVEATGNAWSDYSDQVEAAIRHNERFGDTADKTENALQILTQATGSPKQALALLSTATDLAAAKHEDLTAAATQLGKIYNGNTKLLKQFGINLDSSAAATKTADKATRDAAAAQKKLADAQQKLVDLQTIDAAKKKLTVTETVRLHDAQLKVVSATNDTAAAQTKMNTAQEAAQEATKNQAGAIDQLGQKLQGQAAAQADTFTGKLKHLTTTIEDQAAAFGNKYGPALQIAGQGVAVLGAAYSGAKALIDKHKASVEAATKAGEDGGKRASTLSKAIKGIEGAAGAAAAAIGIGAGATLTGTILAVIGVILLLIAYGYLLYRNWGIVWPQLKQWAKDVFDYIHYSWNNLIGDLKAIPGQIASIAVHMWDGIANAFVDVINYIIHVWNSLQFHLPSITVFGQTIGGESFGVPTIPDVPHLAQGGLITRDGLVYAHAGEAITPAPGRTGPAVVINDAHFSSDVDVELFMRRAAWVVQTQGI
jgi:hypothetical protein